VFWVLKHPGNKILKTTNQMHRHEDNAKPASVVAISFPTVGECIYVIKTVPKTTAIWCKHLRKLAL